MIALTAIVILTALVIAAWKFGGPTEPKVQGVNVAPGPPPGGRREGRVGERNARRLVHGSAGWLRCGHALYRGTLERGQTKRFAAATLPLTLAVASPGNVVVRVAGARLKVPKNGHLRISPRS